jgi:hypothetical protein
MTLTIEVPDRLIEQFHDRQIPDEELKAVAIAALEIWLAQQQQERSMNGGRFSESAVPFVRRLINENRELFEALAQR